MNANVVLAGAGVRRPDTIQFLHPRRHPHSSAHQTALVVFHGWHILLALSSVLVIVVYDTIPTVPCMSGSGLPDIVGPWYTLAIAVSVATYVRLLVCSEADRPISGLVFRIVTLSLVAGLAGALWIAVTPFLDQHQDGNLWCRAFHVRTLFQNGCHPITLTVTIGPIASIRPGRDGSGDRYLNNDHCGLDLDRYEATEWLVWGMNIILVTFRVIGIGACLMWLTLWVEFIDFVLKLNGVDLVEEPEEDEKPEEKEEKPEEKEKPEEEKPEKQEEKPAKDQAGNDESTSDHPFPSLD